MAANGNATDWGNEPTVVMPAYRVLVTNACDEGPMIHVTPNGYHMVDLDCDGICLVCDQPLVARS